MSKATGHGGDGVVVVCFGGFLLICRSSSMSLIVLWLLTGRVDLGSPDSGSAGGLSGLLMYEEVVERVKVIKGLIDAPRSASCVQLMGGAGTGGCVDRRLLIRR